jgi:drug/metabolite transporter (DMT)-like permease
MGIVFAVLCSIGFAANYIFIQLGMKKSKGDNGVFATLFINVLTLSLIYIFIVITREATPTFSGIGILYFVIAGLLTAFLGRVTLFGAIRKIGSSRAAAIKNSAPVFTIVFAVSVIGEHISFWAGIGTAILLLALFVQARHDFILTKNEAKGTGSGRGIFLAVVAAIGFGFGQAVRKQGIIHYADPILGALIGSAFALVTFSLMEAFNKRLHLTVINNFKSINMHFIIGGVVSGLAQAAFFISIFYTNVSYTSVIVSIEPVLTVILAKMFLAKEEIINVRIGVTACAVFVGTFIMILADG